MLQQIDFLGDLPQKIREPFQAAAEDAARHRNAAGILAVCRGCLDVALKELGQTSGGRRERIGNLAQAGLLTNGLAEWAQKLWDDGNDAVHDLEATIDKAIDHVEFLKLFFEVAFALPERIKRASRGGVSPTSGAP